MPYIREGRRLFLYLNPEDYAQNAGELNFQISMLVAEYLGRFGKSYTTCNELMGVLECAKAEFYRRIVAPYEDTKIKENGDVY